jgi:hypothetical protein
MTPVQLDLWVYNKQTNEQRPLMKHLTYYDTSAVRVAYKVRLNQNNKGEGYPATHVSSLCHSRTGSGFQLLARELE